MNLINIKDSRNVSASIIVDKFIQYSSQFYSIHQVQISLKRDEFKRFLNYLGLIEQNTTGKRVS